MLTFRKYTRCCVFLNFVREDICISGLPYGGELCLPVPGHGRRKGTECPKSLDFLIFFRESARYASGRKNREKQVSVHLHNFRKPQDEKNFKNNLTCKGKTAIFGLRQRGNEEEKPSARGTERTPEAEKESAKRLYGKPLLSRRAEITVSPDGCSRYRANERQRNRCKQGGTVEYEPYPTPEPSGAGFFASRNKIGGLSHGRRKTVYL